MFESLLKGALDTRKRELGETAFVMRVAFHADANGWESAMDLLRGEEAQSNPAESTERFMKNVLKLVGAHG